MSKISETRLATANANRSLVSIRLSQLNGMSKRSGVTIFGPWGSLESGRLAPLKSYSPPSVVTLQNLIALCRRMLALAYIGVPEFWKRWPHWDGPNNNPLHTWVSVPVLMAPAVRAEIHQKFDPLYPAFQGHLRSSKVTRMDRVPMTSWVPISDLWYCLVLFPR